MTSMGFLCESFGESEHDVYYKQPLCNFELHRALFSGGVLTREQEATLAYVVGSGPYGQANKLQY